jgi:hypothetical protein
MKEKPILFSTPMVKAILEGRKTMMRRVMKPQPKHEQDGESESDFAFLSWKDCQWMEDGIGFPESGIADHAPYKKGDLLWVRETWNCVMQTHDTVAYYKYKANFDNPERHIWKPSIFMPREAARLFLEVKSVRVEQINNISDKDVEAEGSYLDRCKCLSMKDDKRPIEKLFHQSWCHIHGKEFKYLWDSLNAKRGYSWDSNPWVWVIEFRRIEK